jgi:hypothetical protein
MDKEQDLIRQKIDQARSSLTEKIDTLEDKVRGSVDTAKQKVQRVKNVVDLRAQTEQRPWAMVGGFLALGAIAGATIGRRRSARSLLKELARAKKSDSYGSDLRSNLRTAGAYDEDYINEEAYDASSVDTSIMPGSAISLGAESQDFFSPAEENFSGRQPEKSAFKSLRNLKEKAKAKAPQLAHTLQDQFEDEINMVKAIAVGALVTFLGRKAKESFPKVSEQIDSLMESASNKLGKYGKGYSGQNPNEERGAQNPMDANKTDYRH